MQPDPTITQIEQATGAKLEAGKRLLNRSTYSFMNNGIDDAQGTQEEIRAALAERDALIMRLVGERDYAENERKGFKRLWADAQNKAADQWQRAEQAEADLKKTEQALFAANCMLRDLGVHPATLEKP